MQINALIVDATDPERLAAFWSELLGRPVVGRMGPYVWLRRENGLGLGFQRTAEPKWSKNHPTRCGMATRPASSPPAPLCQGAHAGHGRDGGGLRQAGAAGGTGRRCSSRTCARGDLDSRQGDIDHRSRRGPG
ncbi:VOC family protein [Streptomyces scopuliridis]|uniref:VOC family protein n=1 Tax=Streptomyces scopuliridis TaxID=452529 RepID=UPI0036B6B92E